jgi:hypothetical protein
MVVSFRNPADASGKPAPTNPAQSRSPHIAAPNFHQVPVLLPVAGPSGPFASEDQPTSIGRSIDIAENMGQQRAASGEISQAHSNVIESGDVLDLTVLRPEPGASLYTARKIADGVLELTLDQELLAAKYADEVLSAAAEDDGAADGPVPQHSPGPVLDDVPHQAEPSASGYPAMGQVDVPSPPAEPIEAADGTVPPAPTFGDKSARELEQRCKADCLREEAEPTSGEMERSGARGVESDTMSAHMDGHISARCDGADMGMLSVRIETDNQLTFRVGDLLALVESRMDGETFDRLASSECSGQFVGLEALRDAGFTVHFATPDNQLVFGLIGEANASPPHLRPGPATHR